MTHADGMPKEHPATTSAEHSAARLLQLLQARQTEDVAPLLSEEMTAAAPADRLQIVWDSLGALQEQRQRAVQVVDGATLIQYALRFERAAIDALVTVDAQGRIAGFLLRPAQDVVPVPDVPAGAGYTERTLDIAEPRGPLPATLALPRGDGPFPGVVLVHGSGPHDRNETVGPNRPFLDVARGLADRGIAVLRYDKRTHARPQDFAAGTYTVDDETTDDAVAAIATLSAQPGVDAGRIYVVGHSQGGMLAPRIAARSGRVAGVVMWSAPARSLLTLLPEQNRYLLSLDGGISPEEQVFLDALDAQIAKARNDEDAPASALPLGLPASYWRSFEAIDPLADTRALDLPILLLHGGRDFQVTATDWALWKQLPLSQRITRRDYPANNHLGMPGTGAPTLQEYQQPGHVAPDMIRDIGDWIEAQR